jgi:hypothetical protein
VSLVTHEILRYGDDQRRERGVKIRPIDRRQRLSYCHSPGRFFGSIFDPSATCWDECARCIYLYGRCHCVQVASWKLGSPKSESDHQPFPSQPVLDVIRSAWIRSFYCSLLLSPPWFPCPHTLAYTRARLVWIFITRAAASKRWIIPNLNSNSANTATDDDDPKVVTSINLFLLVARLGDSGRDRQR